MKGRGSSPALSFSGIPRRRLAPHDLGNLKSGRPPKLQPSARSPRLLLLKWSPTLPRPPMTDLRAQLQAGLSGSYALERELGRGGMATVFLAHDLKHDRPVALKVLHPELAVSLGAERFLREIRLAARLQHPHILTVLDSGEIRLADAPPILWFTMPFIRGESLRDRLRR